MSEITVERRPGRILFVAGLLGHPAVVESIAGLLVDQDALDLAQAVTQARRACQDAPTELNDDAYSDAMNALAAHVGLTTFMFHDWDLEQIADAVNERRAVSA